ncbi:MAG: hypothetical protein ACK4N5_18545 [Myxococcales bacterium]
MAHKRIRAVLAAVIALALVGGCAGTPEEQTPGGSDAGTSGGDAGTQANGCATGGGEAPVGPCLVAAHAGTYKVTPSAGTHQRGTVILAADGAVDYDTGLQFPIADYAGVYDRLDCCQRISVEMNQRPDNDKALAPDARHRVDVFTAGKAVGSNVVKFEYYPNWPAQQGKVVLDVTP